MHRMHPGWPGGSDPLDHTHRTPRECDPPLPPARRAAVYSAELCWLVACAAFCERDGKMEDGDFMKWMDPESGVIKSVVLMPE